MNTNQFTYGTIKQAAWTLGLVLLAFGSALVLADSPPGGTCSARTIRGDYGVQMQGTRPAPPAFAVIESVAGVVLRRSRAWYCAATTAMATSRRSTT